MHNDASRFARTEYRDFAAPSQARTGQARPGQDRTGQDRAGQGRVTHTHPHTFQLVDSILQQHTLQVFLTPASSVLSAKDVRVQRA
jgi:hypothetical protein